MRELTEIIVHCTATPEGREVTKDDLHRWHVKDRGWSDIGYHFLIQLDGTVVPCRPMERDGAHVKNRNKGTVGVSYAGGVDSAGKAKDTRTAAQKAALTKLLIELLEEYPSIKHISGHRDYAAKACPSFDATGEYKALLDRKPLEPSFNNPKDDNDPEPSWLEEVVSELEAGNFLQKQGRDALDAAADHHWRALQKARAQAGN